MFILVHFCTSDSLDLPLARSVQRAAVRRAHRRHEPDFHDKYGNLVLLGGAAVFTPVWAYVSAPPFPRSPVAAVVNSHAAGFHRGFSEVAPVVRTEELSV